MEYLLSKEEYAALNARPTVEEYAELKSTVEKLRIGIVGDLCIHSGKKGQYWNCGDCPISATGKNPNKLTWSESRKACGLSREYSK